MSKFKVVFFVQVVLGLIATGCGPEIEVGYQPPIPVPVRISVNSRGEIKAGFSGDIITPIGTFDISGGVNLNSIRNQYAKRVLVVRIDQKAVVYKLEDGKEFKVTFDDNNTLYKKVVLWELP
jgi:hypothetical protein